MDNNKSNELRPVIFVPDAELDRVPLDNDQLGEVVNGDQGKPVSHRVIYAPPNRAVPPPKTPGRPAVVIGDKVLLVMTIVAVLVAFIALLIGGLGLARRGDIFVNVSGGATALQENNPRENEGDRVWLFAIGDYDSRLEYIDVETGEIKGYDVDVISAVCRIANKNCKLVWDVFDRCWENIAGQAGRGGLGLFGGFYDACTAWAVTYSRVRTFKFTDAMSKEHLSVFMISMTADVSAFNWRDLTGKTIGFLQSYVQDENCLKRYPEITGSNLPRDQVMYYITQQELLEAVNNGEVDAVFVNEYLDVTRYMQVASEKLRKCSISGMAIMTRKDNTLDLWWNPAFRSLIMTAEYRQICEGLEDDNVHGSVAGPTLSQQCIGF